MSILINKSTRVICQGITGKAGAFHTKGCKDYGTNMPLVSSPTRRGSITKDFADSLKKPGIFALPEPIHRRYTPHPL